jgi:hypothetical protein
MNNMGLFSKSDKNTKDKNRDVTITINNILFKGGATIQIKAEISRFDSYLDNVLSGPGNQEFWNDIKEKFGKDIDEQELFKVFLFLNLMATLSKVLENATNQLASFSIIGPWGYYIYKDENILGGKLDEKTFREVILRIWEYTNSKEFDEKYGQNKKQKDDQPK